MKLNRSSLSPLPSLPIIQPELRARTTPEKYGTRYYLVVSGLFVLVSLMGWLGYRMQSRRVIGALAYVFHDPREPDETSQGDVLG
jgi:hypothetical protein